MFALDDDVKERSSRPSGRADERRAALLQAAAAVFFEEGYTAASIDLVIQRVGGSKRTIYNQFGSKEGLFCALVSELAEEAQRVLSKNASFEGSLEEQLTDFALRMMRLQMSPTMLGAYRIVLAESRRFPSSAQLFYDKLPKLAADRLSAMLERAVGKGEIKPLDCRRAAGMFIGMGRDNLHLEVVLGLRQAPTPRQMRALARSLVTVFLTGIGN